MGSYKFPDTLADRTGSRIVIARALCARGNLAAQARMTKSPGETVKLHRASFRQNVFDISGTGGYNKDVETPTVATNIEQLSVCEFFIHKPVSRLIAADGSLFLYNRYYVFYKLINQT